MQSTVKVQGPRTGFRLVGHLRSERRLLLIEYVSETDLACKLTGADVWSLKEVALGMTSVLEAERCIDWDGSAKKPRKNVRVEVGNSGESFQLGVVIAALKALAAAEGTRGFSRLGLETATWVAADDALGLPLTDTIRLATPATEQGVQQLLRMAQRFDYNHLPWVSNPRVSRKRAVSSQPTDFFSIAELVDPKHRRRLEGQGGENSEQLHSLSSVLAEVEARTAELEQKLQAAEERGAIRGSKEAAAAIREGFPKQLAFLLQSLPVEQQQHAPPIVELSIKALNKLVGLYA